MYSLIWDGLPQFSRVKIRFLENIIVKENVFEQCWLLLLNRAVALICNSHGRIQIFFLNFLKLNLPRLQMEPLLLNALRARRDLAQKLPSSLKTTTLIRSALLSASAVFA